MQHSITYISISTSPYTEILENSVVALQHPRNRDCVAGFAMSTNITISNAAPARALVTVSTALFSSEVVAHVLPNTYTPYLRLYCISSMPVHGRALDTSVEDFTEMMRCVEGLCIHSLCHVGHSARKPLGSVPTAVVSDILIYSHIMYVCRNQ